MRMPLGFRSAKFIFSAAGFMAIEDVDGIAGRVDIVRGEVDLESADAGKRARRSADFGRVIREGGEVVAVERDGIGELAAGDLHAVAGIAAEADDRVVDGFFFATHDFRDSCRHS